MTTKPKAKTKPVAKKAAPKKTVAKKKTPSTEFSLQAPEASEVYLVGDFNDWSTTLHRPRKYKDGTWRKKLPLKPGRYEYLFLVDGEWWTDPENPQRTTNPFGSENSVITIE